MKKIVSITIWLVLLIALTGPVVVFADSPTPLGGLDLTSFCPAQGYVGFTLTKPQLGHNAAFNNWRCVTSEGKLHPFSMEQACKWQYGLNAVQAHPLDPDDAFTWVCYSVAH